MKIPINEGWFDEIKAILTKDEAEAIDYNHRYSTGRGKAKLDIEDWSDESLKKVCVWLGVKADAGDRSAKLSQTIVKQWMEIKSDPDGQVVGKLENVESAMKKYIGASEHRYVFQQLPDGNFVPWFVKSISHHYATENHPAYVQIDLNAVNSGGSSSRRGRGEPSGVEGASFNISTEDIRKRTMSQIIEAYGYFLETPSRMASYHKEVAKYLEHCDDDGFQMAVTGKAKVLGGWGNSDYRPVGENGRPAKMVIDPPDRERGSDAVHAPYWDKNEDKVWPVPIHPVYEMFDLGEHADYRVHVNNTEPYIYDDTVDQKLVLPDDVKDFLTTLIQHSKDHFEDIVGGKEGGTIIGIEGGPGIGKCHGKGTKILMYDGTIKSVEDVVVGDLLMGDDSSPRKVLSLAHGEDEMFRVEPKRCGNSFEVNKEHVMVFWKSPRFKDKGGEIVEMPMSQYLVSSKKAQHHSKLIRTGVSSFGKNTKILIDPYWLGLWLGDGNEGCPVVTTMSSEIESYVRGYAKKLGLSVSVKNQEGNKSKCYAIIGTTVGEYHNNNLIRIMDQYGIRWNKHIPREYLTSSSEIRRKLLAGLLDTDGSKACNGCYEITQVRENLANDIVFLARSLGYAVSIQEKVGTIKAIGFSGKYWRVIMSGVHDLTLLLKYKRSGKNRLQKKNHLVSGFNVIPLGFGEYFGFTLDGNGRYLLGDFTITHNTLSAEVYSEKMHRPLYKVQSSQLGINVTTIEEHLKEVLKRAERWGAILLIDEADVYTRERGTDIEQNAIVGVFLRVLEYYRGVLFMTTNRGTIIDDAIISRMTARFVYEMPGIEDQKKLWAVLGSQNKVGLTAFEIEKIVSEIPDLSGRDIKNLLKLAMVAAANKGGRVTPAIIKFVSRFKASRSNGNLVQNVPGKKKVVEE